MYIHTYFINLLDMKIFPLTGTVQHYDWGGFDFIAAFLGTTNNSGKPMAEYWLGAHVNAPSQVVLGNESIPLNDYIGKDSATILGEKVNNAFGRLPFLFKILDVKDMLSIQVHPSKQAAVKAFADENAAGIALTAPHRNYKDDNHKPELMVALSDFWLLHGFKPVHELKQTLQRVECLKYLLPVFGEGDYQALYSEVMQYDETRVREIFEKHIAAILPQYEANKLDKKSEDFWAARAFKTFCKNGYDKGLFSIYFFNIVNLSTGQAIFQDAGVPHAYLEGQNLEIMANSDNVLRGGLTPKHVDVPELLKHTRFEATHPDILTGREIAGEWVFVTPAHDFELRKIELPAHTSFELTTNGPSIFLVQEGKAQFADFELIQGGAAFAHANQQVKIDAAQNTVVFHATTPKKD
jgi:mannose-6-phosphate isomerase